MKTVLVCLATTSSILAIGCQSRKFGNTPSQEASSLKSADFVYPGFTGEADWRKEIKDLNPVSLTPPTDYTQDVGIVGVGVSEYFGQIADRAVNPPIKFAAKTALETFRRVRYLSFLKELRAVRNPRSPTPPVLTLFDIKSLVAADNPNIATWETFGRDVSCIKAAAPSTPQGEKCQESWVASFGDQENGSIVGGEASHWNDLQIHFYAATGHGRHGCYTSVFRASARKILTPAIGKFDWFDGEDFPGENETTAKNLRKAAVEICAWGRPVSKDASVAAGFDYQYIEGLAPQFAYLYNSLWVDKTGQFISYENRPTSRADATTKELVNMFEYIMLAQTFAFDDAQQQQVINAFYGDHKLAHENKDIEIDKESDCNFWRPVRYDNSFFEIIGGGTRCNTNDRKTKLGSKNY